MSATRLVAPSQRVHSRALGREYEAARDFLAHSDYTYRREAMYDLRAIGMAREYESNDVVVRTAFTVLNDCEILQHNLRHIALVWRNSHVCALAIVVDRARDCHLRHVFVAKRRRGDGRRLCESVLAHARKQIFIESDGESAAFWRAMGYERRAQRNVAGFYEYTHATLPRNVDRSLTVQ